jgi:hypothetical protein
VHKLFSKKAGNKTERFQRPNIEGKSVKRVKRNPGKFLESPCLREVRWHSIYHYLFKGIVSIFLTLDETFLYAHRALIIVLA